MTLPSDTNHARAFRSLLWKAGVRRTELHTQGVSGVKAITAYDWRSTGITWRAVRGDAPLVIKSAAGHRDFKTTEDYIKEIEPLRDGFGDVFPPLPERLFSPQTLRGCLTARDHGAEGGT